MLAGLHLARTTVRWAQPREDEVADLGEPIGTVVLELPLRGAGFVLPGSDELVNVVETARAHRR